MSPPPRVWRGDEPLSAGEEAVLRVHAQDVLAGGQRAQLVDDRLPSVGQLGGREPQLRVRDLYMEGAGCMHLVDGGGESESHSYESETSGGRMTGHARAAKVRSAAEKEPPTR